ncbi:ABC transporter substrate-binding protein [Bacillaceae bacterium JMAK1]|nr:ABC transporter substrate-binding protein [Bacillaceae bacterium JMAK1]
MYLGLLATLMLTACGNNDEATTTESEQDGGTINIAYGANPQTLDPHLTTNQATRDVSRQIYEQLLVLNEDYEVVPSLAEDYEVSDDGLTYTFQLREGVLFHNGEEMVASDVVASMQKWLENSTQGQANLQNASFEEVDPYTVTLTIDESSILVPNILADTAPFPGIMPKEIAEAAGADGVDEHIGTGPFQLEDWRMDQHTHLTKFDDYQSRDEEPSGLSGRKEALVDDIYFHYITDESTRVSGMMTGEYDIGFSIPADSIDQIDAAEGVHSFFSDGGIYSFVFNNKAGIFTDLDLRQAFNMAIDYEDLLIASYGDDRFYELDSALALPSQSDWYSEEGSDIYDTFDVEAAKALVEQSSYDGEEVVILTTRDYPEQYNMAVVAQQALQDIGLNVTLDVYDWPTVQELRTDENNFDVFAVSFAVRPTLHQYPFLASTSDYPGWTNNETIDENLGLITQAESLQSAAPYIDELQQEVWDDLPITKIGNIQALLAVSDDVSGYSDLIGPILWNVSIDEE